MDVFEGVRVVEMASWQLPVGLVRAPVRMDGCAEPLRHAPGLGEHADEVLGEIGYTPGDIAPLRRSGTVG